MSVGQSPEPPRFIWATRGRTWGYRFLRRGGLEDPLSAYEALFADLQDQTEGCRRMAHDVALRFPDPSGRQDAAGRVISHDFVLIGSWADEVNTVEDGRKLVWGLVSDEFDAIWDNEPPHGS